MNIYQVELADNQIICLSQATQQDIASASNALNCDWLSFWSNLDLNCEAIIKLEYKGIVQGLMHIALYPYPPVDGKPEYLEIIALEATQKPHRFVNFQKSRRSPPVQAKLSSFATELSNGMESQNQFEKLDDRAYSESFDDDMTICPRPGMTAQERYEFRKKNKPSLIRSNQNGLSPRDFEDLIVRVSRRKQESSSNQISFQDVKDILQDEGLC